MRSLDNPRVNIRAGILNDVIKSEDSTESVVLVPVNFSEEEAATVASCIHYAQSAGLAVLFYHTCSDKASRKLASQNETEWVSSAEERMEELMRLYTVQLIIGEVPFYTHVDTEGVKQGIEKLSQRFKIDLIVTNGQGESRWFRRSLNRLSSSVLGFKDIPVLVVPVSTEMSEPRRIVLALNSNERYSHEQFAALRKFAKTYTVQLQVLEVINGSVVRKWNNNELNNWLRGISYDLHTIYGDNVAKSISEYAEQVSANLICVISFADYPFRSLIDPSVTKRLAPQSKVPLLVLK